MKILVGAFSIESNSFVPSETFLSDFERQVWSIGEEVTRDCAGPASELAGAWDALVQSGLEPVGAVAAAASPGAPVAREVFDVVCFELLSRCTPDIAGADLMLHGSALVTGIDDPEGYLLREMRRRLGPAVPIAISLDLHAYMTEAMMSTNSIVTAYRTCPHVDLYRTGRQAGELLARTIEGTVDPVCRRVRLPMITPPERHDSSQSLFSELQALCTQVEEDGALSAALLCTHPWLDVPELGWSAVVTWDADSERAHESAQWMAQRAWSSRAQFLDTSELPLGDALDIALAAEGTFVIADLGDATNGGSLGDSTELLRALLARRESGQGSGPSTLTVTDRGAVERAWQAGEGASITLEVGSGSPGEFNEMTTVHGTVRRLWEGPVVYSHPAALGVVDSPGQVAVIEVDDISLIVHARPVRVIDPAIYSAAGIDISRQRIVQAKSHVSYRAGFDDHMSGSVLADTRGPTAANLTYLPFTRRPNPLFPFENAEWSPVATVGE